MSALTARWAPSPSVPGDNRLALLRLRLAPDWRPDEWDASTATLEVRTDGTTSALTLCRVTGCDKTARSRHGLCATCRRDFERSGASDRDVWVSTAVRRRPQRSRTADSRCIVQDATTRCARPATATDVCTGHRHSERAANCRGLTRSMWLLTAKPLQALPDCEVHSCTLQSEVTGLCRVHIARFKAQPPTNREQWLRTQEPPTRASLLWLGALPELVVGELVFAMQDSDSRGTRLDIEPIRVVAREARRREVESLLDLPDVLRHAAQKWWTRAVNLLRVVYEEAARAAQLEADNRRLAADNAALTREHSAIAVERDALQADLTALRSSYASLMRRVNSA